MLTPIQEEIVRSIAFPDNNRIVISCMTRYGKSWSVAQAVLLYILDHPNQRILLIAPIDKQTAIIRNWVSEFIMRSPQHIQILDIDATGADRLKAEVSKNRITFKNGCSLQMLSAEGTAERLMGFGGDLIVLDESCMINYEVYRMRISRMLGDNPNSILVEIGNPWDRNNQMYEHWIDPSFKKIHVGYQTALAEGRATELFIEEQRKLLTPIEFSVLYEAEFPEEAEDSIFNYKKVQWASKSPIEIKEGRRIISCDVADKGKDFTVVMWGIEHEGFYDVKEIYSEATSENMQIVGKIVDWYHTKGAELINVDTIGVGVGVVSRLKEVLSEDILNGRVRVQPCHFGMGVGAIGKETKPSIGDKMIDRKAISEKKRFLNRKAEQYFRLRELFLEEQIKIPEHKELISQLMKMRWELTSAGKIHIIDPEDKSPDQADALCYFVWKAGKEVIFDFGGSVV